MRVFLDKTVIAFLVGILTTSAFWTAFIMNAVGTVESKPFFTIWMFTALAVNFSGLAILWPIRALIRTYQQAMSLLVVIIASSVSGALVQAYSAVIDSRQVWIFGLTVAGSGLIVVINTLLLGLNNFRHQN